MSTTSQDSWRYLQAYTNARIALGRAGSSLPTRVNLQFQLDHARARDAVHRPLDFNHLEDELSQFFFDVQWVHSEAPDRTTYLQRPDLGRRLRKNHGQRLRHFVNPDSQFDVAIVIADGLSSAAVQAHAVPLLNRLVPQLVGFGYSLAPICLAEQARVALGDDIGEALKAKLVLVLIGERPGLSSPDSLGIYLTYQPKRGKQDSQRNCISNVRPEGLDYDTAGITCLYLIQNALRKKLSGVALKDESVTQDGQQTRKIPFFRTES